VKGWQTLQSPQKAAVKFLTFSCELMRQQQTVMRRQTNGALGGPKTDEEEILTMSITL